MKYTTSSLPMLRTKRKEAAVVVGGTNGPVRALGGDIRLISTSGWCWRQRLCLVGCANPAMAPWAKIGLFGCHFCLRSQARGG
jgi:hypothetical protein